MQALAYRKEPNHTERSDGRQSLPARIWHAFCKLLGFYKNPPYIEEYLKEADVRSAQNLSLIIAVLETWMLIRQVVKHHDRFTSASIFFSQTWGFWVLLTASGLLFLYARLYLSGRLTFQKKLARLFIFLFFLLGIYFGIVTSLSDLARGRMITCFLTMTLAATLIVVWRPWFSFLLTASVALIFVRCVNATAVGPDQQAWHMSEAELVNYTIYMIVLATIALSMYIQRYRDARKSFELQKAHEREMELVQMEKTHLSNLFSETTEALASAIDAKDRYTHGHSARVAEYSAEIARRAGKSESEVRDVYFAALLHDVGKIGVDEAIINKAGKLTDEEFEQIKLHTVWGWQILSHITHSPTLSQGAHFHHEKINGKGYPEGLSGDFIPEIARIIAVADAYDAMTSKRSYRNTLPQAAVRQEIEKESGSQFDPVFAKIMLEMIDEDVSYRMREYSDTEQV